MPTSYPAEFRRRAIAFVRSGGSVTKTAHDLDVTSTTIYNWVKRAEIQMGPRTGMTDVEREKLAALRKENYEIKRQRDSACGANFYVDCAIMPTSGQSDGVQTVRCWWAVRRESA